MSDQDTFCAIPSLLCLCPARGSVPRNGPHRTGSQVSRKTFWSLTIILVLPTHPCSMDYPWKMLRGGTLKGRLRGATPKEALHEVEPLSLPPKRSLGSTLQKRNPKRGSEKPPQGRHFKDQVPRKISDEVTPSVGSEEPALGALQRNEARNGSSEEEPPWEASRGARPEVEVPKNPCQGKRSIEQAPGEYSRGEDPEERLRRATPGGDLQQGGSRDESSEEETPWKTPQEQVPCWILRGGSARGSAPLNTLRGEGLARVHSVEEVPKNRRQEVLSWGRDPGNRSEERPPWEASQRPTPRRTLRGELTREKAPPHHGGSKKNAPSGG